MSMVRVHIMVAAAILAVVAATLAGIDRLARASESAGVVWLFVPSANARAMQVLPAGADARLLDVAARGHVLRVHVRMLDATDVPIDGAWSLRWPSGYLGWPACG